MTRSTPEATGLLLAGGAGRRMGTPKALLVDRDGVPRLARTVDGLLEAGCTSVTVVLGAAAEVARPLLGDREVRVVVATDWAEGMGASLRAGLRALAATDGGDAVAALVTLVDLPDVGTTVLRRVLDAWETGGGRPDALLRATYAGRPGHPVLLGRDHWGPLIGSLEGDTGAQPYLRSRKVQEVTCDDLATGRDLDRPDDLPGGVREGGT
jgi:CTP:molybdopterin cytidylyltransferase MocA